jgi:porin
MFEFGFIPDIPSARGPLIGGYRFGVWYDPQPKERYFANPNDLRRARYRRDDVGFYASFDQMVYRESKESDQGFGLFFRYGFAHGDVNELEHFWSLGGQYQGLLPKRDDDVLGFGVAMGLVSNELGYYNIDPHRETVMELYYKIKVFPWLDISPDVQYIFDPGGRRENQDCLVMGMRLQMSL